MTKRALTLLALSAFLLAGCGSPAGSSAPATEAAKTLAMPDLTGLTVEQAEEALAARGISDPEIDPVQNDFFPTEDWIVSGSDPRPGQELREGAEVVLIADGTDYLEALQAQLDREEEQQAEDEANERACRDFIQANNDLAGLMQDGSDESERKERLEALKGAAQEADGDLATLMDETASILPADPLEVALSDGWRIGERYNEAALEIAEECTGTDSEEITELPLAPDMFRQ